MFSNPGFQFFIRGFHPCKAVKFVAPVRKHPAGCRTKNNWRYIFSFLSHIMTFWLKFLSQHFSPSNYFIARGRHYINICKIKWSSHKFDSVGGKEISSFYCEYMAQTEMILEYFAPSPEIGWGNLRKACFFHTIRQFITIEVIVTEGKHFFHLKYSR